MLIGGLPQLTAVSQVFPTQTVVGWYSIGSEPTAQDVVIHDHVSDSQQDELTAVDRDARLWTISFRALRR